MAQLNPISINASSHPSATAQGMRPDSRSGGSLHGWFRVLALALVMLLCPIGAMADTLPSLTGRVVDDAGMIDTATEAAITAKLEAFEKATSAQLVVATVTDLGGEAIEPYANRLFRAWKLGQAGDDNGVLLLVAKNDRKMRIEVGYGLEGTLTDLHSKLIIENTMVPAFRAGDFSGGISKAVDQILMVLEGNAAEIVPPDYNQSPPDNDVDILMVIFFVVWGTLFFGGFAMAFLVPIFGKKTGPGKYRWLGMNFEFGRSASSGGGGWSSGRSSGGGWSSGGSGGFSGGGGSSGGGGASGSW